MKNDDRIGNCRQCEGELQGPVRFCPFCGTEDPIRAEPKKPGEKVEEEGGSEQKVNPNKKTGNDVEPPPPPPIEKPDKGPKPPWGWLLTAVVCIIGLFILVGIWGSREGDTLLPPPAPMPTPARPVAPSPEVELLVRNILDQGTRLSTAVNKLPQLERVRQAAQKLVEISPARYQPQLDSAEDMLEAARRKRDASLEAYLGLMKELRKYDSAALAATLSKVRSEGPGQWDGLILELLERHYQNLSEKNNLKPKEVLQDFIERFELFQD